MKTSIAILITAISLITDSIAGGEHLGDTRSPLLTTDESQGEIKGIWIPNSYGGVTGVELDLSRVGTDGMLSGFFRGEEDGGIPFLGRNFKLHSDETTNLGNVGARRRVILVDSESLQGGRKMVICYTASYNLDRREESGIPLSSESTQYTLTISEIRDDLEVLYLLRFGASFPNNKHPTLTKPPKREQVGTGQPATRSQSKSEGGDKPQPEAEGRSR
jgi:hypothetical protein